MDVGEIKIPFKPMWPGEDHKKIGANEIADNVKMGTKDFSSCFLEMKNLKYKHNWSGNTYFVVFPNGDYTGPCHFHEILEASKHLHAGHLMFTEMLPYNTKDAEACISEIVKKFKPYHPITICFSKDTMFFYQYKIRINKNDWVDIASYIKRAKLKKKKSHGIFKMEISEGKEGKDEQRENKDPNRKLKESYPWFFQNTG